MFKSALVLALAALPLSIVPQTAQAGACSTGFIEAYKKVVVEIKTIAVAVKDKEVPKNLVSAVRACDRLESTFNGYRCEVNTQSVTALDLQAPCAQIRELAKSLDIEIPSQVPAPQTADANTPVSTLAPAGLSVRINNAAEFSKMIAAPKAFFFINGRIYDFASSVMVKNEVRCTVVFPGIEKTSSPAQAAQVFKSNLISEEVAHDHFYTRISLEGVNWTLDCTKHVYSADTANTGITFGELKSALGSYADLTYKN